MASRGRTGEKTSCCRLCAAKPICTVKTSGYHVISLHLVVIQDFHVFHRSDM